jgi:hypothetical protein
MLNNKTRNTIVALIASAGFGTAALAPAVSQAQPREGDTLATCDYEGTTYGQGEQIVVISGAHYDYYFCGEDGEWHLVEWHPSELTRVSPVVKKVPVPAKKVTLPVSISGGARLG